MKKIVPVLVASGILLLSFQNCSQQQLNAVDNEAGVPATKIEDPVLSQAQSLDILTQSDQKISLNLVSGELLQEDKGVVVRKCLSESMRAQIQDVLSNSNLCEFEQPAADMACAQVYSAPYSEIHWLDKSIKVGEARSSCHKDVDLCGNDGKLLRGLLKDVISRWSEWSCDFKIVSNQ